MDSSIVIYGHVNASDVDLRTPLLVVGVGGIIGADGGGSNSEQGKGAGKGRIGYGGSGAGHGGYGSTNCDDNYIEPSGQTYGDVTNPTEFGSGGGMGSAQGGNGGGAIKIKSSTIWINGTITANGNDATQRSDLFAGGGGGSGGSIIIQARFNIFGKGLVSASGGKGAFATHGGGGGGGGRIMLNYTYIDQALTVQASGGKGGCNQPSSTNDDDDDDDDGRGQDGTIYKPCPVNQYSEGGKLPCAPCSHGKIWKNYVCASCPAGYVYLPLWFINNCVPSLYLVMLPCFALTFVCFLLMAASQMMRLFCKQAYRVCCMSRQGSVNSREETQPIMNNVNSTYYSSSSNRVVKPTATNNHTLKSDTTSETVVATTEEALLCDICFVHQKDTALNCGHVMCEPCSEQLYKCPYCKQDITSVMKVYL